VATASSPPRFYIYLCRSLLFHKLLFAFVHGMHNRVWFIFTSIPVKQLKSIISAYNGAYA